MNFEGGKKNTSGLFAILAELTVQLLRLDIFNHKAFFVTYVSKYMDFVLKILMRICMQKQFCFLRVDNSF